MVGIVREGQENPGTVRDRRTQPGGTEGRTFQPEGTEGVKAVGLEEAGSNLPSQQGSHMAGQGGL